MDHFQAFMPADATKLLGSSLRRAQENTGSSLAVTVIGFFVALWAVTGAMNSYMIALKIIYGRKDRRSFLRKRIVALKMAGVLGLAVALVTGVTILGPVVESAISSRIGATGGDVLDVVWWVLQWPILLGALLVAFATSPVPRPRTSTSRSGVPHRPAHSSPHSCGWRRRPGLCLHTASSTPTTRRGDALGRNVTLTWLWIAATAPPARCGDQPRNRAERRAQNSVFLRRRKTATVSDEAERSRAAPRLCCGQWSPCPSSPRPRVTAASASTIPSPQIEFCAVEPVQSASNSGPRPTAA
jgi:hypothetical protein